MAEPDDVLRLIDDADAPPPPDGSRRWKIAVIDDDPAVHDGTRFALCDYRLNGQGLEIISAYSADEGRELMREHPDIAVVLLDVVMETDNAGLDLVQFIRNELKNETVRIILRTGQPGQAPERRVIVDYDINDYKAKTELTADKLFTSLTAALRSYQQLQRMVETRRGLEIIIDAASTLYDFKSMQRLAEGVLTQIASLLNVDCAGILVLRDDGTSGDGISVLAGSGCYSRFIGARDANVARRRTARAGRRRLPPAPARIPGAALGPLHPHRQRPRGRRAAGSGKAPLRYRSRAGRDLLEPAVDRLRQRHPVRAAAGGERAPGGARRPAHARAHRGQSPPRRPMGAAAARQRLQERNSRHRRARPEEPARRHSRPHRNAQGDDRQRRLLARKRAGPDRPHPRGGQAADGDGRQPDRRRHGRRARHHDPARAGRSVGPGPGGRGDEPAAGRRQGPDHFGVDDRRLTTSCATSTACARRSTTS